MPFSLKGGFSLGPRSSRLVGVHGHPMRIDNDLRKSVLFLGHGGGSEPFTAAGTGFLMKHRSMPYIVTARHVVEALGNDPYALRVNLADGETSGVFPIDEDDFYDDKLKWFFPDDPSVDVAVLPFPLDFKTLNVEFVVLQSGAAVPDKPIISEAGCGDYCYAIGLFRLHQGRARNLPIVHTGHIALMPNKADKIVCHNFETEAYLVEISNLSGLSGAPVLVRQAKAIYIADGQGAQISGILPSHELMLLGVWSSSFEGYTDARMRVPVGIGVVTPAAKLVALLDSDPVSANREWWWRESNSAKPDDVGV